MQTIENKNVCTAITCDAVITAPDARGALLAELVANAKSEARKESLLIAYNLGVDAETLQTLALAERLSRREYIDLPALRYESLSRGRGWCRSRGKRDDETQWGERIQGKGYRVGPGKWSVGATDGFSRKDSCDWVVYHVTVGNETWTVAE